MFPAQKRVDRQDLRYRDNRGFFPPCCKSGIEQEATETTEVFFLFVVSVNFLFNGSEDLDRRLSVSLRDRIARLQYRRRHPGTESCPLFGLAEQCRAESNAIRRQKRRVCKSGSGPQ
jgi:hypothetical protein